MPTVNNRRLLPLNGVMPMDGTPGGDEDPNKENKAPTESQVPEEKADPSSSSDESESEASDESSSSAETVGTDEDDPALWNKPTLVRSIKYAYKQYDKLKDRFQKLLDQIERLNNDKTNLQVRHQVVLTGKNTTISNLRSQLESKSAIKQSYEKKYREEIDTLKTKNSTLRKTNQDLKRELNQLEKDNKKFCTEKDNAKRKATAANLDWIESKKQVTELKQQNKKLKKELDKKTEAVQKFDEAKLAAQVEVERQRTERKKFEQQEKTARFLKEQELKDADFEKKVEFEKKKSEMRMQEKAKVRKKKDEEDKKALKEQQAKVDTKLSDMLRSAPAARQPLPNNGKFPGMSEFYQLMMQQAAQAFQQPSTPLPSMLSRLGGGSGSGSSSDAISIQGSIPGSVITQPMMSPPARQLTLTQMDRERTPEHQPLPPGVQKLTDDASGEKYYVVKESDGSKSIYMSYDELMEAMNSKTGESTAPRRRRDWRTEALEANIEAAVNGGADEEDRAAAAAQVTPATFGSQVSELTMTQRTGYPRYPAMSQQSLASLEEEACDSADTASEDDY